MSWRDNGKEQGTCDEDTFKGSTESSITEKKARHHGLQKRIMGVPLNIPPEVRLESILRLAPGLHFLECSLRLSHLGSLDFLELHKAGKNEEHRGQAQVKRQVNAACH